MVALKKGVSVRLRRSRDSWGLCLLPQFDHSSLFLIQAVPRDVCLAGSGRQTSIRSYAFPSGHTTSAVF